MKPISDILSQGVAYQQKGRYKEALRAYDAILARDPDHPDALNLSGIIASRTGDYDKAVRLIKRALIQCPHHCGYLNSLGNALQAQGERQAALDAYREGLARDPGDPDLLYNVGRLYKSMDEIGKAADYYQKALRVNPDDSWTWNGLGNLQKKLGKLDDAAGCFRRAIELNPQFGEAYNNLANTCREQGRYDDAHKQYRKALELAPDDPQLHANLGVALQDVGRATEAIAAFQTALKLDAGHAGACRNLGNAYLAQGRVPEALACYRGTLERSPQDADTHSNLLCALNNAPDHDQAQLAEKAREWWRKHGTGVRIKDRFGNWADPQRRLKVGYVSPDFRQHSVSYFFKPLLAAHDREAVEVFCYADVVRPDRVSRALRGLSDHWRDIVGRSDQFVFEQVVDDEIDILVDLAGHTSGNRLKVFARQPAPVQVAWLGYPNTTGVPAMHYRLTDAVADPPGDADRYHTEALVRLPHGFLCYQPPEACPDIAATPALASGRVTFGSFNNIAKLNPDVIRVWAEVLQAVPGAKLLLKSKQLADESVRLRYRELFTRQGVSPDQLEMLPFVLSSREHMAVYNRVDVALDTFPYNGTTTTCEALWMGVPVVTLRGARHAARVGASLLTHGGHPELIAGSEAEYLEKAVALVSDLNGLDALRQALRARLQDSPLCDAAGFAGDLERTYRGLWSQWCRQRSGKKQVPAVMQPAAATAGVPYKAEKQVDHRGPALTAAGNLREAVRRYSKGELGQAAQICRSVIDENPDHADALHLLGCIIHAQGHAESAVPFIEKAVAIRPEDPRFYNNLGLVYAAQGKYAAAVNAYRQAHALDSTSPDPLNNLGLIDLEAGNIRGAVGWFEKAIHIRSDHAFAYNNLGLCKKRVGAYQAALYLFEAAIERDPGLASAHWNRALTLLLLSQFEEGWREYEWRFLKEDWRRFYPQRLVKPRWNGAPIPGKRLLVHYEQGFGDIIQFVRYLPMVKRRSLGTVIFETKLPLKPLLQEFSGIDELVVASSSGSANHVYDFQVPLLSLPGILGPDPASLPLSVPYLQPCPDRQKNWQAYMEPRRGKVNVGLVWAGRAAHSNDTHRSFLPEFFAPIFEMPNVKLFAIQQEMPDPIDIGNGAFQIENVGSHLTDFADTAAVIDSLDLLITVDTAVAHLAGAMGRPVWTLLPYMPDWRWQLDRDDSPWYPTMRLFRQARPGEWLPVILTLTGLLKTILEDGGLTRNPAMTTSCLGRSQPASGGGINTGGNGNGMKRATHDSDPDGSLYNRGVSLQKSGKLQLAVEAYVAAIELDPQNMDAYYNLANCQQSLQQLEAALENYKNAIRLEPAFAGAYNNMGLLLKNSGELDEAIHCFTRALELEPGVAGYHNNLGLTCQKQADHAGAVACFKTAVKLEPDSPVFRYNLSRAFECLGEEHQAIGQLAAAIKLNPDFNEAYHNLGKLLETLGRYDEAAENFRQAVRIKPDRPEPWNGLGNALTNLGRTGEATDCYKKAILLRPAYAGAHLNLGTAYYEDRQLDLAETHYQQALDCDHSLAEAEFNLGLVHLLRGDLQKGWPGYEKRFDKTDWAASYPFRLGRPKWDGRPFKGKRLLIHDEQGLGDTLQFVRYLELVKPLGGTVLFETRRPLLALLKDIRGADQVIERSRDGKPPVDFDLYCPLLSLPMIFSTGLDTIPGRVPYLKPDAGKTAGWSDRLDARAFKVGIVWSGNPTHFRGLNRSASLADFEPILRTPAVRFYGFQTGPAAREATAYAGEGLLENLGAGFADFGDTAAAMAHMDLMISIDTSVAHLAGVMGKPVWLLLARAADWRWLMARDDSPWYPTMRLFRQQRKNDWAGVVMEVQMALADTIKRFEQ